MIAFLFAYHRMAPGEILAALVLAAILWAWFVWTQVSE